MSDPWTPQRARRRSRSLDRVSIRERRGHLVVPALPEVHVARRLSIPIALIASCSIM